ncbi:hypothetical protein P167DRAFT_298757 [Morchella conica CCBAS932]|uniref:Secreted protein n=1 Tax=Morchella conica CCBAS932 TaxID=1392247 RepID=A0A3N4KGB1_9PEZI|nr:hypothetical protein P167DRAFT_298757 [Morchella conica CCBAS932]
MSPHAASPWDQPIKCLGYLFLRALFFFAFPPTQSICGKGSSDREGRGWAQGISDMKPKHHPSQLNLGLPTPLLTVHGFNFASDRLARQVGLLRRGGSG